MKTQVKMVNDEATWKRGETGYIDGHIFSHEALIVIVLGERVIYAVSEDVQVIVDEGKSIPNPS